jgi:hypothetical protein
MTKKPDVYERKWPTVILSPIQVANHIVTVPSTKGLHTKQVVTLSLGNNFKDYTIKRVLSNTQIQIGLSETSMVQFENPVEFNGGTLSMQEQNRNAVGNEVTMRAVYMEEPAVALRSVNVDRFGQSIDSVNYGAGSPEAPTDPLKVDPLGLNRLAVASYISNTPDFKLVDPTGDYYTLDNPLPVRIDGNINIQNANINVNLNAFDSNPDSILIVGTNNGTVSGIKSVLRVDNDFDLRVGISDGANKAQVNSSRELAVTDVEARNSLADISSALTSIENSLPESLGAKVSAESLSVTFSSDQTPIPVSGNVTATLSDEPIKISGTENGQPNGPEFTFVNNRLQQILKAKDRTGTITYADFGNKNQRITQITYTAPSIGTGPGFTAVKTFTYTLVGNKYRRDTPGDWTLV